MKKFLALLLAIVMLFALVACNNNANNPSPSDTTGGSESTETTQTTGTTETTEGTVPPVTDHPVTDPSHTHSYSSAVTTPAGCTTQGLKTFTCACGSSYTEAIAATDHSWGQWTQTTPPTAGNKGVETRTCTTCAHSETRNVAQPTLDDVFRAYPPVMMELGYFESADTLFVAEVLYWCQQNVDPQARDFNEETSVLTLVYSVPALDAFTTRYLGCTFDFASLSEFDEEVLYDAEAKTLTLLTGGSGGPLPEVTYNGYTTIDTTHFEISYTIDDFGYITKRTLGIELKDGTYIAIYQMNVEEE